MQGYTHQGWSVVDSLQACFPVTRQSGFSAFGCVNSFELKI
jgi:hypothetical protein